MTQNQLNNAQRFFLLENKRRNRRESNRHSHFHRILVCQQPLWKLFKWSTWSMAHVVPSSVLLKQSMVYFLGPLEAIYGLPEALGFLQEVFPGWPSPTWSIPPGAWTLSTRRAPCPRSRRADGPATGGQQDISQVKELNDQDLQRQSLWSCSCVLMKI